MIKCACPTGKAEDCSLTGTIGVHEVGVEFDELPADLVDRGPRGIGSALRDAEYLEGIVAEQETARQRYLAERVQDETHLCNRCIHSPVCTINIAIKVSGGEKMVTVSRCGAFATLGELPEFEPK